MHGEWARWTNYELLNGVIVPDVNAQLKNYDSWGPFQQNRGHYRTVRQPYIAVLELARKLEQVNAEGIRPTAIGWHARHLETPVRGAKNEADRLILDWCREHGLLGLLSVRCGSINANSELRHFRDGGQWYTRLSETDGYGPFKITKGLLEYGGCTAYSPEVENPDALGLTWLNWKSHELEPRPIKDVEAYFRPMWAGGALCIPRPNTAEFWTVYGEPVVDFVDACSDFARSIDIMSRWKAPSNSNEVELATVQQAHRYLSGLAKATAYEFSFDPAASILTEERYSAGLLATYALMFLLDWKEGRRARQCGNCAQWFVSNEHRARYCSPRCRNTSQSRRYRKNRAFPQAFRDPFSSVFGEN